jgi:hypothetical protein
MEYNVESIIKFVISDGHIVLRGDGGSRDKLLFLIENGRVSLDIRDYFEAVPEAEWHRRHLALLVAEGPMIVASDRLRDLLEKARPLVERVIAGHSVEWDGSNQVGRLTYDASEAFYALDDHFRRADLADEDLMLWTVDDWLGSTALENLGLDPGADDAAISAAAADLRHTARTDGVVLVDDASLEDALRKRVVQAANLRTAHQSVTSNRGEA